MASNKMTVDFQCSAGKMKPMHAVNNGPVYKANADQRITNFYDYRAAGIPYARNHDASFFSTYGGEHTVDVNFIFPDFDADPYDPASYDFACTDEYIRVTELAGAETFYRLGSKIEHGVKKYNTYPPKDFKKWAIICEYIIRHYTEGWADGFRYKMTYWEIWNEPDMIRNATWQGTREQFFELYEVAATHLKEKFPHLKIGGPAVTGVESDWEVLFLDWMTKDGKKVPLDFFSWHLYNKDVEPLIRKVRYTRNLLDKYGYTETESILNEWNYMRGWEGETYEYSIRSHFGLKGASFTAAYMCVGQQEPLDMLMYYDARPCGFNGMWAPYLYDKLKGYYPFYAFNVVYRLENSVKITTEAENLYACAAKNDTEAAIMLVHYEEEDNGKGITFTLDTLGLSEGMKAEYYLLDEEHDLELILEEMCRKGNEITLKHNAMLLIRYK